MGVPGRGRQVVQTPPGKSQVAIIGFFRSTGTGPPREVRVQLPLEVGLYGPLWLKHHTQKTFLETCMIDIGSKAFNYIIHKMPYNNTFFDSN